MLFAFLRPLGVIMPELKKRGGGRDWNLTLVVGSYGFAIALMVCAYLFHGLAAN